MLPDITVQNSLGFTLPPEAIAAATLLSERINLPTDWWFENWRARQSFSSGAGTQEDSQFIDELFDAYTKFNDHYKPLFEEGVATYLPLRGNSPFEELQELILDDECRALLGNRPIRHIDGKQTYRRQREFLERLLIAHHVEYGQHQGEPLFHSDPNSPRTLDYTALLLSEFSGASFPSLAHLHPDKLLHLREVLSDSREDFVRYLQQCTAQLHQAVKDEPERNHEALAHEVVHSGLLPRFYAYRTQVNDNLRWIVHTPYQGRSVLVSFCRNTYSKLANLIDFATQSTTAVFTSAPQQLEHRAFDAAITIQYVTGDGN